LSSAAVDAVDDKDPWTGQFAINGVNREKIMSREKHIESLHCESYDILVIGGGATGTGCALDAASRGLKVALVERDDFAAGTSSRSTKLIHGGVRYLEQAVLKFDRSQFKLVRDALHERATLLRIAPHLAQPLPILTPLYNRIEVPYYRTGLRLYDRLAGKSAIHKSYFVSPKEALHKFPMLKSERLRGGVVYFDGQFDDARMNIGIAVTAAEQGATIANHVEVLKLNKAGKQLSGAHVRDRLSGKEWDIRARVIINATGPFADTIRRLDDPECPALLSASSGTHIVVAARFSPPGTGLLIPKTEDGRVLFILPWLGHTLIGTTDNPAPTEPNPKPRDEDIDFILRQVKRYFTLEVEREHILSSWTGLRPLVSNPKAMDTAKLSRDHIVHASSSGLITIAGGKWTTYRRMALDTVNHAVDVGGFSKAKESQTENIFISGGENFRTDGAHLLEKEFSLEPDIAEYLNRAYGSRAVELAQWAKSDFGKRIIEGYPHIDAEVVFAARKEWARSTSDILARRTRLSFLDKDAALKAVPRVAELLGKTLERSSKEIERDVESSVAFLS
jgi:glycerol-3-phosphate dehydrogenase